MKHIVSAVPGRLRIKDPQFSDPLAAGKCIDAITREFPVVSTRVNPGAQSIVVHYDANLIALSDMRAGTERVLAAILGLQARYPEERKRRRIVAVCGGDYIRLKEGPNRTDRAARSLRLRALKLS